MSHNIETNARNLFGQLFTVPNVDGEPFEILFYDGSWGTNPTPGITIPRKGEGYPPVLINGEDLYAFRELLNELPEEAFVRPADPVGESYIYMDRDGDWWALNDLGYWEVVVICGHTYTLKGLHGAQRGVDGFFVDHVDGEPSKPPRWTDGDIVRPPERDDITYIRHAGAWDRHIGGSVSRHDSTDGLISNLVDGAGYIIVLQASGRG